MAGARLSRRKIAAYIAEELVSGRMSPSSASRRIAAFLVESKRIREAEVIVRDIEAALADLGVLVADVTGGRELESDIEENITHYLKQETGADSVYLRQRTDPHLLGGVRIDTPGFQLDNTLRHRLNQLTASKI